MRSQSVLTVTIKLYLFAQHQLNNVYNIWTLWTYQTPPETLHILKADFLLHRNSFFSPNIWKVRPSSFLITDHEVLGSISGSAMGIFPWRGRSPWWQWSGYFSRTKDSGPSWYFVFMHHHPPHRGNVTVLHGLPNLRSRLHFGHNR
jgi:hypothetical protein